jgi:hypothetical protein
MSSSGISVECATLDGLFISLVQRLHATVEKRNSADAFAHKWRCTHTAVAVVTIVCFLAYQACFGRC